LPLSSGNEVEDRVAAMFRFFDRGMAWFGCVCSQQASSPQAPWHYQTVRCDNLARIFTALFEDSVEGDGVAADRAGIHAYPLINHELRVLVCWRD
jgi:hypothetical protein